MSLSEVRAQKEKVYKAPEYELEWSKPTLHPDRIVLNLGADPKKYASVTWRTSSEITTSFAEIAVADAAPKFWRTAKTLTAKTETFDGTEIMNAGFVSNYHSVSFND